MSSEMDLPLKDRSPVFRLVCDLERSITNLEGATCALNNFVEGNPYLTTEFADGLQWLTLQIDAALVEVRNQWDKLHPEANARG